MISTFFPPPSSSKPPRTVLSSKTTWKPEPQQAHLFDLNPTGREQPALLALFDVAGGASGRQRGIAPELHGGLQQPGAFVRLG